MPRSSKNVPRLHGVLRRRLHLQEEVAETASQDSREALHHAVQIGTHLVVHRVRNHAVQVLAESAHIRGDAHLVVVQDDGHVLLGEARIVERLVSHTAGHGAVTDNGHHVVVAALVVTCNGETERRRNRSRGMPCAKAVVFALVPLEEPGNTARLAERAEPVVAARQ